MGLFDFLKKEKRTESNASGIILGMILLDEINSMDIKSVVAELRSRFNLDVDDKESQDDTSVLSINGYSVAIAPMPVPIPGDEVKQAAAYNYFWENGTEEATYHKGHIILSVMGAGKDHVAENLLFSQVASAILNNSKAVGVYVGGRSLVLRQDFYQESAAVMSKDELPLYIWIYFGLRKENGKHAVYTYGLADFGKKEMEIINSTRDLDELNDMMYNLVHYVISHDVTLKSGETIGLSAEQKLRITESKGRYLDGNTLKIDF